MLTQDSYLLAWSVYALAAAGTLLCLHLWWLGPLRGPARLSLLLLFGVLMLTPARPGEDLETWAPAIVVAGFDFLTEGPDAALGIARLLALMSGLALLPGLLWALLGRGRKPTESTGGA